jgi:hypothetical protein
MKKALLVGINDYPGTFSDLMGCVNDVENMEDLLVSLFGFARESIVIITDRDATTINILKALEMLVHGAQPGDLLIFHYSGHGSQVPDRHGDEPDRLDETICPVDFDWKENVIRDDDFSRIFDTLDPEVHLEVFLDSCHSGTGLKGLESPTHTKPEDYRQRRFLPMPVEIAPAPGTIKRYRPVKPQRAQVLWAACKANQYAADAHLNGQYGGAFTTSLCLCVRQAGGKLTRSSLLKALRANLKKNRFDQVPQLETAGKYKKAGLLS